MAARQIKTTCAGCLATLIEGDRYCPYCGRAASVVVTTAKIASDPAPAPEAFDDVRQAAPQPMCAAASGDHDATMPGPNPQLRSRLDSASSAFEHTGRWPQVQSPPSAQVSGRVAEPPPPSSSRVTDPEPGAARSASDSRRPEPPGPEAQSRVTDSGDPAWTTRQLRSAVPEREPSLRGSGVSWRAARLAELVAASARDSVMRARDRLSDPSGLSAPSKRGRHLGLVLLSLLALAAIAALIHARMSP